MTPSPLSSHPLIQQLLQQLFATERNVVVLVVSEDNRVLDYDMRPMSDVVTLLDASGFGQPLPEDAGILHQILP